MMVYGRTQFSFRLINLKVCLVIFCSGNVVNGSKTYNAMAKLLLLPLVTPACLRLKVPVFPVIQKLDS